MKDIIFIGGPLPSLVNMIETLAKQVEYGVIRIEESEYKTIQPRLEPKFNFDDSWMQSTLNYEYWLREENQDKKPFNQEPPLIPQERKCEYTYSKKPLSKKQKKNRKKK